LTAGETSAERVVELFSLKEDEELWELDETPLKVPADHGMFVAFLMAVC